MVQLSLDAEHEVAIFQQSNGHCWGEIRNSKKAPYSSTPLDLDVMTEQMPVPSPPKFSDEEIKKCRESGDFMPMLFEWYKFVGHLCIFFALIKRESPAFREIPAIQYSVLTGLLNRCARLMLANIALSHNGRFGETTALLDRCIFESCVKVRWLCHKSTDDAFSRYLADGLKTEVELSAEIQGNITTREGNRVLVIEERMLKSIKRHMALAGLTEVDIAATKKLPNTAAMLCDLGQDRLMYVVGQRIGSHHVHGTWTSLLMHYLEEEDGSLVLRDHDCDTHPNQFVTVPLLVLTAMDAYIGFMVGATEDIEPMKGLLTSVEQEILKINSEMAEGDFDAVPEI